MPDNMKIDRSLPFFHALLKAPHNNRSNILQAFPTFVVDDLVEVLYNIVLGHVDIGSRKKKLKKHQKILTEIVNTKSKKNRRSMVLNQKGGFIAALLPIIMGLLGPALFGNKE